MLNIGRLAPGAAEYYIGEVATSAEDYYTGRGESEGRWVGSLAVHFGLHGPVAPDDFRAVLEGRNPQTGEHLVRRAGRRQHRPPAAGHPTLFDGDHLDVPQLAARLRLSTRQVRRLLATTEEAARTRRTLSPSTVLLGERRPRPGWKGPAAWVVSLGEVERFESERRAAKGRPGYDLTLRPPKSVSVVWALAEPSRRAAIRDAHRAAVDAVVDYYEAHAAHARRGHGDRGRIETDGLVAAAFDHRTSRAGDPLLHTHVVTANLTRTAEGRWQALDGRSLYDHARAGGFLYQAHLRHLLTRDLGVRFAPVRNGWAEIEGVPERVIRTFSKRRDEIEDVVAESGHTSARAHQAATLATRAAKDYGVDADTLDQRWREEAAGLGFGPGQLDACFGHDTDPTEPDPETLFTHLAGPEGLTCHASTFTRRHVVQAVAERAGAACSAGQIEAFTDRFLATSLVQPLAPGTGRDSDFLWRRNGNQERVADLARFTTPELLALEDRLLRWAADGFGTPVPTAAESAVDDVLDARPELTDEQRRMVHAVCGPAPAIQPVAGRPGTGKTFATAACVEALLASGVPVVGCALSATAAAELEAAADLGPRTGQPASTIARLLRRLDREPLPHGAVVIVDEASMVGTRDLARLAHHVQQAGGALKLVGDPDQHGPVETGGLFRKLVTDLGSDAVALVRNNRQEDPDERAATEEYRQDLVESALARYDAAGKVHRSPTAAASYDAMVADWLDGVRTGGTDPMIAGPNRVRRALNERARARLDADGHLNGPTLTAAGRELRQGDWVVARRNAYHLRSANGAHFVKNGSAGRVADVDIDARQVTVDFATEGRITLPAGYLDAGWVDYGYARTTYGVQGATLRRALYHPGDASSFEEGYVALTRGRCETRIYLVDGAAGTDDEVSHPSHQEDPTGLETVVHALEQRRSRTLAVEADPTAAGCAAFTGWTLGQLRAERRQLDAVLGAGPRPVGAEFADAVRRRDQLLAQRRACADRLPPSIPEQASRSQRSEVVIPADEQTERRLATLDRALTRANGKIADLAASDQAHRAFLDDHRAETERLALIRAAELAREVAVRAGATAAAGDIDGPLPRRQALHAAAEQVAVHIDHHGVIPIEATDPVLVALGDRPVHPEARWSYERAEEAFRDALATRPAVVAESATLEVC